MRPGEPKAAPKTFKETADQFLRQNYKDSTSDWQRFHSPRNVASCARVTTGRLVLSQVTVPGRDLG